MQSELVSADFSFFISLSNTSMLTPNKQKRKIVDVYNNNMFSVYQEANKYRYKLPGI